MPSEQLPPSLTTSAPVPLCDWHQPVGLCPVCAAPIDQLTPATPGNGYARPCMHVVPVTGKARALVLDVVPGSEL